MKKLDVFIAGETVDLCIPTLEFAKNSQWYSWFNNKKLTRYLDGQGLFPYTADMQAEFFNSLNQDRLTLIVSNKSKYLGVVALSSIDMITNTCDVATVVDPTVDFQSPYLVLESVALITQYAFDVLGINRISGGMHMALSGWRGRMELLGYMVEGIKKMLQNDLISQELIHNGKKLLNSIDNDKEFGQFFDIIRKRKKLKESWVFEK